MPIPGIVTGQRVNPVKVEMAGRCRRRMTPAERILWQRLRAGRLRGWHFRRQQVIAGFIVDFYCHSADLVIELDGGVHNRQHEYDRKRDAILTARGLRILRIPNKEVLQNLPKVIERIAAACGAPDVGGVFCPSPCPPSLKGRELCGKGREIDRTAYLPP